MYFLNRKKENEEEDQERAQKQSPEASSHIHSSTENGSQQVKCAAPGVAKLLNQGTSWRTQKAA